LIHFYKRKKRMPLPIWIHCNICSERQAKSWHISSCGKITCQNCLQKLKVTHCGDCKGPCARTIELNSRAPKDVLKLFGDVQEEIKKVSKIIDFQDKQKAKFLFKLKNNNNKLDKRRAEMKKVKKNKLGEIEEVKRRLAAAKEEIKRKNSMIKFQKAKQPPRVPVDLPSDSLFRTAPHAPPVDCFLSPPRSDQGRPRFFTSTPVQHLTQPRNHSLDGDFMMLKTPAAWHGQGGGRRREEADRRSLDRMRLDRVSFDRISLDRNRADERREEADRRREEADRRRLDRMSLDRMSLDRMSLARPGAKVKSPVEMALDKLLEDDPPVKLVRDRNRFFPHPRFFTPNYNYKL